MALSHLRSAGVPWDPSLPSVRACDDTELNLLDRQLETGLRCVPTSSMGRLFDAVASLAGICHRAEYDAQAAMELEALARPFGFAELERRTRTYYFGEDGDPAPVIWSVVQDVRKRTDPGLVAARFQAAVVDLVVDTVRRLREQTGLTHGDPQRRGLPQRLPHRGLRRAAHVRRASRCSRTTRCRPATPASPWDRSRCSRTARIATTDQGRAGPPEQEEPCA